MSFEIFRSDEFTVALKKLAKRHKSLADDYARFLEDLKQNPFQGVEIAPNIRKVAWLSLPREGVNRVVRE